MISIDENEDNEDQVEAADDVSLSSDEWPGVFSILIERPEEPAKMRS